MRTFGITVPRVALAVFFACIGLTSAAFGEDGLTVDGAWVRLAPPTVKAHGGYLTIKNSSDKDYVLVGASSPSYGRVELHVSKLVDGVASMSAVSSVSVGSGKSVEFKPGGLHLMLMMPKGKQVLGETVPVTLTFENGAELSVDATVSKGMDETNHKHHEHH